MFRSMFLIVCLALVTACAGFETQPQKIAVTCESIASSADAVAAGVVAGRVNQDQQAKALRLMRLTIPYCQPPVDSLDDVKFAALKQAAAELAVLAGSAK